jgi:manganese/zinc/iron transport system substrate-binding protein
MRRGIFIFLGVLLLTYGSIQGQNEPLRIVATTTQAADLVTILTADLPADTVEITGLMGAGVDPHLYKPTESDVTALNAADFVIYMGLHLEGQFDEVFAALSERGVRIYALSQPVKAQGFTIGGFDLSEELTNVDDPHFWFDPRNWLLSVEGLAAELSALDPANAATYARHATEYNEQLTLLYEWALAGMAQVHAEQRYLVTSHDAFQYFGDAFGWEMRSVQGISTVQEAGVGDIQAVVDFIVENEIPVLFVESSVPPNTINAVQEAVKAAGGTVRLGVRELYSDAMDAPETFGGTYSGMLATNVYTILQSYQAAGIMLEIPAFPAEIEPQPPAELLAGAEE